jgi:hypothetical protein
VSLRERANSFHYHYSTIYWIKEKIEEFREAWPASLLLVEDDHYLLTSSLIMVVIRKLIYLRIAFRQRDFAAYWLACQQGRDVLE